MRRLRRAVLPFLALACLQVPAPAWWPGGHLVIDRAAIRALPEDMPRFFREAGDTIAAHANDPDLWKHEQLSALREGERPKHYLDLELLKDNPLPRTRGEFIRLCQRLRLHPHKAGLLPYAIQENYERLTFAFAEYRRWPKNEAVRAKILYLAGVLSHYTADAAQPLHLTVHFDGRAGDDGTSPRTGIHSKLDALPGRLKVQSGQVAGELRVTAADDLFARTVEVIRASHEKVEEVYQLEQLLPEAEGAVPESVDDRVRRLCLERCRAGAEFTATVWYTAWIKSASIELPPFHHLRAERGP